MKQGTTEEHISRAAAMLGRARKGVKERKSDRKAKSSRDTLAKFRSRRWPRCGKCNTRLVKGQTWCSNCGSNDEDE